MNKHIEQILKNHFLKHSTQREDQELQHWRDKDDYNDEEYLRLREAWKSDRTLTHDLTEDEKWAKFKKKHFKPNTRTRILRRKSIIKYSMVLLFFIALITAAIYYSGSDVYRTSEGERELISLDDGSRIWLREDSRLTVGRVFSGFTRDVNLNGSAIFDIEPNTEKEFTALGSQSLARGNGGVWLFTATDNVNKIEVLEGSAHFWRSGIGDTVIVNTGQEGIIKGNRLIVDSISKNDPSWFTGHFNFKKTPLKDALTCLQDHYKVNLKLKKGVDLKGCRISGTFDRLSLKVMLDSIQQQVDLKYRVSDQTITVNQVKCPDY